MSVDIDDLDLVRLDGICNPTLQPHVDAAKARLASAAAHPALTQAQAGFVADTQAKAVIHGRLSFRSLRIVHCAVCKVDGGYAVGKRTTRWRRKGQVDHSKPLLIPAVDLVEAFITVSGYATHGCCLVCFAAVRSALADTLRDVRAEIPEAITGHQPRWVKSDLYACPCGWSGPELAMGKIRGMFSGCYHGACPACPNTNQFLVTTIKRLDSFVVLPVPVVEV